MTTQEKTFATCTLRYLDRTFKTRRLERLPSLDAWLAMTAIITFAAEGAGTRYSARVLHKSPADARKHDDMGFQDGWGTTINQLAKFVAGEA